MDICKTIGKAGIALGAAGGLYLGFGALICHQVLGRNRLNSGAEEFLCEPGMMKEYICNPVFHAADDWFTSSVYEVFTCDKRGVTLHAERGDADKETHKWAICVHGFTSRPRTMSRHGHHYHQLGYNVLMPYLRGHRKSEEKISSMGYFERFEVIAWIDYVLAEDPLAEIVIHGCSMGSVTCTNVTGEALPGNVKACVADCGFTTCMEQFTAQIKKLAHLPPFPFLNAGHAYAKLFLGWDFNDNRPVDAVARSVTPTLFIHGSEDDFVPYEMMPRLYEACSAEKDCLTVPGAGHDNSVRHNPELYWEKVDAFLKDKIC